MADRTRKAPTAPSTPAAVSAPQRIAVRKTYKLYVGGQFPRSESGRSYVVRAADGAPLANAVRSSRKDLRDAIRTARGAVPGWAGKTAMNRGQVLYRVAELMEGRRAQFIDEVAAAEGLSAAAAQAVVDRAIDRWVWYAGWADKISQVLGTVNPVGASYFNFTIPEATGVVGVTVVGTRTGTLTGAGAGGEYARAHADAAKSRREKGRAFHLPAPISRLIFAVLPCPRSAAIVCRSTDLLAPLGRFCS